MVETKRWCILRHSDSDLIGEIFSGKRKVYNASDGDVHPLPPFEYFIPFEDLKQKPVDRCSPNDDEYKSYDAMLDDSHQRNKGLGLPCCNDNGEVARTHACITDIYPK